MHHWTQFDLFINHYRNNQHIFRCCTGMTPWHGGGLGAVRLYIYMAARHSRRGDSGKSSKTYAEQVCRTGMPNRYAEHHAEEGAQRYAE